MTEAERRIWYFLRSRHLVGFKFRRQHPIGPYVVDFACLAHKLVIELDGSQHATDPNDGAVTPSSTATATVCCASGIMKP